MMSNRTKVLIAVSLFLIGVVYIVFVPDKEAERKRQFLVAQNLKISGIVKQVMPLRSEEHGYGAIYLQHFTSNKGNDYTCNYKDEYLFCTIAGGEAIIVTPGINEIEPGDSVVYDTQALTFKRYRKGTLAADGGIAINTEDSFYQTLKINGYLDFSFFRRHQK